MMQVMTVDTNQVSIGALMKRKTSSKGGITTTIRSAKNGGVHISLKCETCGEPITRSSWNYGMDCKNKCSEKEFKKMRKLMTPREKAFMDMFLPKPK